MSVLITIPKPRAELGLLPLGPHRNQHFRTERLSRWGDQAGQGQAEILAPSAFRPSRNFNTTNVVLYGPRGSMKSWTLAGILTMFDQKFHDPSLGPWCGVRRCMSNFWVDPVFKAGPLGAQRMYAEDKDGAEHYGMMPIDPCDPEIVYKMGRFPLWGYHRLEAIDEIDDIVPGGAMSRKVRDIAAQLKQQRSMRTEIIGATNAPQHIQRTNVLHQIDLLALVKPHFASMSVELLFYDFKGTFTGNYSKYRYIPPREDEYDWIVGIGGLYHVKDLYDTFEITPPSSWSDEERQAFIAQRWAKRPTYASVESPFWKELPSPNGNASSPGRATPQSAGAGDPLDSALLQFETPLPFEDVWKRLRDDGYVTNRTGKPGLRDLLKQHGYHSYQDKGGEEMVDHS